MKKLSHYLHKIKAGKTINYPLFLQELPANVRVDKDLLFKACLVKPKHFQVEVLDEQKFEQLLREVTPIADDRVSAALIGDSHKQAVSTSYLLVFHQQLITNRPDVVVLNNDGCNQGFTSKKTLLVIENQENFFRYQQMLPLLSEFYGKSLDLSLCDIAFGLGLQINKALNISFVGQYDTVLCAFDYDLGALRMVEGLKQRVKGQVELLQPNDFTPWLDCFCKKPNNDDHLVDAIALAHKLGYSALGAAFKSQAKFVEQEVFLAASLPLKS